jgi:hypothetical protein
MRDPGTTKVQFNTIVGSLLGQFTEMSGQRCSRNSQKLCGLPLITCGLLVNQTDMSPDR